MGFHLQGNRHHWYSCGTQPVHFYVFCVQAKVTHLSEEHLLSASRWQQLQTNVSKVAPGGVIDFCPGMLKGNLSLVTIYGGGG